MAYDLWEHEARPEGRGSTIGLTPRHRGFPARETPSGFEGATYPRGKRSWSHGARSEFRTCLAPSGNSSHVDGRSPSLLRVPKL